ncbi:hypothetical protein FACS1894103_4670 [Campylobacterota bacterium]|nr:hypothetical protein FACS1894103_4670 [Campylobacterota bacterium]
METVSEFARIMLPYLCAATVIHAFYILFKISRLKAVDKIVGVLSPSDMRKLADEQICEKMAIAGNSKLFAKDHATKAYLGYLSKMFQAELEQRLHSSNATSTKQG